MKNNLVTKSANILTSQKKITHITIGENKYTRIIHTKFVEQVFTIMQGGISENIISFVNRHFFGDGRELTQERPKSFHTFTICQSNIGCAPWTKLDLTFKISISARILL